MDNNRLSLNSHYQAAIGVFQEQLGLPVTKAFELPQLYIWEGGLC